MVAIEISAFQKLEILFLKLHPKGPQLTPQDIAEYLSIDLKIINEVCSEKNNWNSLDDVLKHTEKNGERSASSNGREFIHSQQNDAEIINGLQTTIKSLRKQVENYEAEKQRKTESEGKESEDLISITEKEYRRFRELEFYDRLQTKLGVAKSKLWILQSQLTDLYSNKFTAKIHQELLDSIDHEALLKAQLESTPIHMGSYTTNSYNENVPVQSLLLRIKKLSE